MITFTSTLYRMALLLAFLPVALCVAAEVQQTQASPSEHAGLNKQIHPAGHETPDALSRLVDLLSHHQQWQANFVQQVTDEHGELIQRTEGQLYAQKPFKLNWQALEPYPETIVSNGITLWRFDPDLEQVIIEQLSPDFQQTPVLIFSGDRKAISDAYVVIAQTGGDSSQFQLLPRDENSLFTSLSLVLDEQQVYSLSLEDTLSQTSTTTFSAYQHKQSLDSSLFEFQVPAGIDVIEQ